MNQPITERSHGAPGSISTELICSKSKMFMKKKHFRSPREGNALLTFFRRTQRRFRAAKSAERKMTMTVMNASLNFAVSSVETFHSLPPFIYFFFSRFPSPIRRSTLTSSIGRLIRPQAGKWLRFTPKQVRGIF